MSRQQFKAWARTKGATDSDLATIDSGNGVLAAAWTAWQESRRQLGVPDPQSAIDAARAILDELVALTEGADDYATDTGPSCWIDVHSFKDEMARALALLTPEDET